MKHRKKGNADARKSTEEGLGKIELLSCISGGGKCKKHLSIINEKYVESYFHQKDKNYLNSLNALKSAFLVTNDLTGTTCSKCAEIFRFTITRSVEDIHDELKKLSTGLFKTNRFQSVFIESRDLLKEFKRKD